MEAIKGGLRQRKGVFKTIEKFDAFPKVPEDYQETTTSGGTVSILVFLFIGLFVISEVVYLLDSDIKYSYEVDKDALHRIRLNIDLTVAMECEDIGADVLDLSGTSLNTETSLKLEPTFFKMSKNQAQWLEAFHTFRKYEEGYRSINDVTKMSNIFGYALPTYMPPKDSSEFVGKDFDACRIYGNVEVNKVAGNFHITAGKSVPHPRGHAHLSSLVSELNYNFSHRIDLLSFGDPHPGIINPLDGDLQLTEHGYHMYQYYVKIVPTYIKTFKNDMKAHQYSVTTRSRRIQHSSGSHGVPGIFFKYDFNAVCVQVKEQRRELSQFFIRLCGIIGGVFATSGMLHSLVGFLADFVMCQIKKQRAAAMTVPLNQQSGFTSSQASFNNPAQSPQSAASASLEPLGPTVS